MIWGATLGLVLLTSFFGAWAGSKIYSAKNRNPLIGGLMGAFWGFFPPFFPIYVLGILFLGRLEAGDKGYFASQSLAKATTQDPTIITKKIAEARSMLEQNLLTQDEYEKIKSTLISQY